MVGSNKPTRIKQIFEDENARNNNVKNLRYVIFCWFIRSIVNTSFAGEVWSLVPDYIPPPLCKTKSLLNENLECDDLRNR